MVQIVSSQGRIKRSSTVTAGTCPLLSGQLSYSRPLLSQLHRLFLHDKTTEAPPPLPPPAVHRLAAGCFFFSNASFWSKRVLVQLELEGGDLHGIQAYGRFIGQRRAGVHQSQGHRLEQLQVQILEQARYTQLQREIDGRLLVINNPTLRKLFTTDLIKCPLCKNKNGTEVRNKTFNAINNGNFSTALSVIWCHIHNNSLSLKHIYYI